MAFSPTVERWMLARTLRQLRKNHGLDSTKVAKALGWNPGKVSYIEGANSRLVDPNDVKLLLREYGIQEGDDDWNRILQIVKRSRYRGWWHDYRDVFAGPLPDLEAGAAIIRTYELTYIPGLFQTPDYAAAIIRAGRVIGDEEVERRVDARMRRQEILAREEPPEVWAVIDETALRKTVGSVDVMIEQLEQLCELAERPRISIQILPDTAGAHMGMNGPFTIMWFAGPGVVYHETPLGDPSFTDEHTVLDRYAVRYSELVAQALALDESAKYLNQQVSRLVTRRGLDH